MVRAFLLIILLFAVAGVGQTPEPQQPPPAQSDSAFTDADGAAVLRAFAGALEAHSLNRFLATFDANAYPRFSVFSGEMDSFFGRYDQFRVHYQLKEATSQSDTHGEMLAQVQIEAVPVDNGAAVRRNGEVRFNLVRVGDKWKIAGFSPRELLS